MKYLLSTPRISPTWLHALLLILTFPILAVAPSEAWAAAYVCRNPTVTVQNVPTEQPVMCFWTYSHPDILRATESAVKVPTGAGRAVATDSEITNTTQAQVEDIGCTTSQPVDIVSGNKVKSEVDFLTSSTIIPLGISRAYDKSMTKVGVFGAKWVSNIENTLTFEYGGSIRCEGKLSGTTTCSPGDYVLTRIFSYRGSGYYKEFRQLNSDPVDFYNSPGGGATADSADMIYKDGVNWKLVTEDGRIELYDAQGRPLTIKDERGVGLTYDYANGKVSKITHANGRSIALTWIGDKISSVTDPASKVYTYAYNSGGYLASVTYPDNLGIRGYLYEDAAQPGGLTGITVNGERYSRYSYYPDGRAKQSGLGFNGEIDRSAFEYGADYVNVTNSLGLVTRYQLGRQSGVTLITQVERPATVACPSGVNRITYDPWGRRASTIDARGMKTNYTYNLNTKRLTQRVTGIGANGETDQQQITQYAWVVNGNRMVLSSVKEFGTSLSQPISEIVYDYYPDGHAAARLLRSVRAINRSGNGVAGEERIVNYTYSFYTNGITQTEMIDGPLAGTGDQITRQFDIAGNLTSITNGVGQAISYSEFNSLGLPERMTGANGNITDYAYDAQGRTTVVRTYPNGVPVESRYVYGAGGLLDAATTPDGNTTYYHYDAAHRLTQEDLTESGGGYAVKRYTYDAMSNPIKIEVGRDN